MYKVVCYHLVRSNEGRSDIHSCTNDGRLLLVELANRIIQVLLNIEAVLHQHVCRLREPMYSGDSNGESISGVSLSSGTAFVVTTT